MDDDNDVGDGHGDDQVFKLGKEEREKQNSSMQRYI
jgi:stress response protein SCP2